MYTQCSKCETVFELSAEVLRTAGGQVRCGNCGEVFNALARLAEKASAFVTNETSLELETRADSILESVVAVPAAKPDVESEEGGRPGVEIARLEVFDWPEEESGHPDAGRSMEFTLPPGELDRIFVDSKKTVLPKRPAVQPPPAVTAPTSVSKPLPKPAPKPAVKTATHHAPPTSQPAPPALPPSSPSSPTVSPPMPPVPLPETEAQAAPAPEMPPHPESVTVDSAARSRGRGLEIPDEVRRDMLEGFERHIIEPTIEVRRSSGAFSLRRSFNWWLGAAVVSALLLMAQVVHENREWFVSHGPIGAVVRTLYGAVGSPLPQPSNLSAYQLRQWGVTGDPEAKGILRLRASILNAAPQLQPYPLLRVTLADRFGKSIGSREFEPSEYMGRPTARLLSPGERADATLEILDPGKNAEGFEIDVCLRGVDRRVSCANDIAPQGKR